MSDVRTCKKVKLWLLWKYEAFDQGLVINLGKRWPLGQDLGQYAASSSEKHLCSAQNYCDPNERKKMWGRVGKVLLTVIFFLNQSKKGNKKDLIYGCTSPTDFWNLKRAKSSNFPPQLGRSDSLGCPLQAKLQSCLQKGELSGSTSMVTWSNILPCCCPPALPTSSTCKPSATQRVSPALTFQQNHKAFRICPLDLWLGNVCRNGKSRAKPGGAPSWDTLEQTQPICLIFHCSLLFLPLTILFFLLHENFPFLFFCFVFSHSIFLSRLVTNKHFFRELMQSHHCISCIYLSYVDLRASPSEMAWWTDPSPPAGRRNACTGRNYVPSQAIIPVKPIPSYESSPSRNPESSGCRCV